MNTTYKRLILIFLFCCGLLFPRDYDPQLWWQVELRLAANGEYALQTNNKGFEGNYSFTATVLGTMEDDDDDDFIFVQAHREIPGLKWQETIYNQKEKKQYDLHGKIEPEANLNYVFARDGALSFDIEIMPVLVPYENSLLTCPIKSLHLPESSGDNFVVDKHHYNSGITSGSNRIVVAVKDMYSQKDIHRVFRWQWQEKDPVSSWTHHHQVEATLTIIPLKKQDK
ncbi:MAG: hypothetical protein PVH61_41175 [Candidatus Aminicenantes bacterium]|jgi:hypothetical protein